MESHAEQRIARLEKTVRIQQRTIGLILIMAVVMVLSAFKSQDAVIRTQGIVIVDSKGKERILIGAPIPEIATRKNPDAEAGIVILNEKGRERVVVGQSNPSYREEAYGMLLFEDSGQERGGIGVTSSGKAVIALDRAHPDRDAIGFMVDPATDFVGMMLLHKLNKGKGQVASVLGVTGGEVSFDVNDASGVRRVALTVPPKGDPKLESFDREGKKPTNHMKRR